MKAASPTSIAKTPTAKQLAPAPVAVVDMIVPAVHGPLAVAAVVVDAGMVDAVDEDAAVHAVEEAAVIAVPAAAVAAEATRIIAADTRR